MRYLYNIMELRSLILYVYEYELIYIYDPRTNILFELCACVRTFTLVNDFLPIMFTL